MDLVSQNLLLTSGGKKDPTYIDDVFSTYLWKGNETARTIPTGVDNTEGALAWVKSRNDTHQHHLVDTERGSNKVIYSDSFMAESTIANRITGFTNNGFNVGSAGQVNGTNVYKYAGWNFRKQKGFFDIVKYDGNATSSSSPARQIAHNLGSVPGCIMIKCTTANQSWAVYHRGIGNTKYLGLNGTSAATTSSAYWGDTDPTSTHFTVKHDGQVNETGHEYVAYIFAGGESTAATARSLTFDGSYDSLQLASSSDFNFGTGDFTFEGWLKPNNNTDFQVFLNWGSDNPSIGISNDSNSYIYYNSTVNTKIAGIAAVGQWTHYAISRSSGTTRLFLNGDLKNSFSDSHNYGAQALSIGAYINGNNSWNGSISNVRIVKGTAVYTSSFRPPYEPLTNITNTKLLCCNNSSTTGSTVTPGTITVENNVTASTDSPFDDPEGFQFGEEGDHNLIKTGSYLGNGSSTGPEINLGWEPQWLLIKNASTAKSWKLLDSMRGIVTGDMEAEMQADQSNAEHTGAQRIDLTSTGFKVKTTSPIYNGDGDTYIFICLRRSDGYVGKPVETATSVFAMDTGAGTTTIPNFDSGFPVDFAVAATPAASGQHRQTGARLTGPYYMRLNGHNAESGHTGFTFDSNAGWGSQGDGSNWQSWMWKRHAGFDVVTYAGNSTAGRQIPHSLNKVPEMIWLRSRTTTGRDWVVYHKSLNGGVNPWLYKMRIDHTDGERSNSSFFGTASTARYFGVGTSSDTNGSGENIIAFLFSSVDGISKVGSYDGSATSHTITTGFQPRMVIIKEYSTDGQSWWMLDTVRGWTAGNDNGLQLNSTTAQTSHDFGAPTATGFTLVGGHDGSSNAGKKYIYYAHA